MEQFSPLLQAHIKQQQTYQTQNKTNPFASGLRVDIGGAKLEQLNKDTVQLISKELDYSIDDGKISTGDKIKSFGKGLISPITAIFSSPKNFLIGAGMIAAGAALTIATGGAIAPVFVALGVTGGAIQLGTSIYKASKATTDDEAKSAWLGMGAGTSAVGMSVLGSKAALKGAGVDTKGMGFLRATVECFKQVPSSISKSVGAFTSGKALVNLENVCKPKKSANPDCETKNNTENKIESKAKPKVEPSEATEIKSEPKTKPVKFSEEEMALIRQDDELMEIYETYVQRYDILQTKSKAYLEGELFKKIRPTRQQALEQYQADVSICLNDRLRNNKPLGRYSIIKRNLDNLFDTDAVNIEGIQTKDSVLYRGLKPDCHWNINGSDVNIADLKPGDIFTERGFSSTSISQNAAQSFAGENGYMFKIIPNKETPLLDIFHNTNSGYTASEMEVLLRNGTQFQVLNTDGNVITLGIID